MRPALSVALRAVRTADSSAQSKTRRLSPSSEANPGDARSPSYLEKDGKAAAEVPLQAGPLDTSVEIFTIDLVEEKGQGVFRMSWGNRVLSTRFTAK